MYGYIYEAPTVCQVLWTLILTAPLQRGLISSHSVEEMEAQGCEAICPRSRSHAGKWPDLGLEPRSRWYQS